MCDYLKLSDSKQHSKQHAPKTELLDEILFKKRHKGVFDTQYLRMGQVKFLDDSLEKKLKEYGLLKQNISLQIF